MFKPALLALLFFIPLHFSFAQQSLLNPQHYKHYIEGFNSTDNELYSNLISNNQSWDFLSENIPLLDCPDKVIERIYYFRWWTYRKHIKKTPEGFVITEFLPDVPWSGKYNTISCPAALHFYEGRWLKDQKYLNSYANFWFKSGGSPRLYSFWAADAIYNQYLVSGNPTTIKSLLPHLIKNYQLWEQEKLDSTGLFWQVDDRDGMEVSICGNGYRPTINSYMFGDAMAISEIAKLNGNEKISSDYVKKASLIRKNLEIKLWDNRDTFFKVLPRAPNAYLCEAKELHGYTPWYFNMPGAEYSAAWKYLMSRKHFSATFGLTSAEQADPSFSISYQGHECQWNGPSWPYATSVTLTAMANLINNYQQDYVNSDDYFHLLKQYSSSQQFQQKDGTVIPWIDENLNPFTGDWISRTRLKVWDNGDWAKDKGGEERGKDYNHSTYCDLVISGLIGIRPQPGNMLIINPLIPLGIWPYFCLDKVNYHGKELTVFYDQTGKRYKKGKGFYVLINGKVAAHSRTIKKLIININGRIQE